MFLTKGGTLAFLATVEPLRGARPPADLARRERLHLGGRNKLGDPPVRGGRLRPTMGIAIDFQATIFFLQLGNVESVYGARGEGFSDANAQALDDVYPPGRPSVDVTA